MENSCVSSLQNGDYVSRVTRVVQVNAKVVVCFSVDQFPVAVDVMCVALASKLFLRRRIRVKARSLSPKCVNLSLQRITYACIRRESNMRGLRTKRVCQKIVKMAHERGMVWRGLVDGVMLVWSWLLWRKYRYMTCKFANICRYVLKCALYCTYYCRCVTCAVLLRVILKVLWLENLLANAR